MRQEKEGQACCEILLTACPGEPPNKVTVVEIESASLDYSCDQDKKENGISGCLCEVQRQTDG